MDALRVKLLTEEIVKQFENTALGHCARVDFLHRVETDAVCQRLTQRQTNTHVLVRILTSDKIGNLLITADQAIEIRNRKRERLCLFVPADLVDAACNSLANSFAIIDGRTLHATVLKQLIEQLPKAVQQNIRTIFHQFKGVLHASVEQQLDFVEAVHRRTQAGEREHISLELWRVGLIADASATFIEKLDRNRRSVLALALPLKLDATPRQRIQNLKVDKSTATALDTFFRGRAMNDVRSWSQALAQANLTLDRWVFPTEDPSDIRSVTVQSFINPAGAVEKYCHLIQPDGPGGSLLAPCGPKKTLVVRWKSDPETPKNIDSWRIQMVSTSSDSEATDSIDLPERDIKGHRSNITIKLDMEFAEPPGFGVCIRVIPLDVAGNMIPSAETREHIVAESNEFFLVREIDTIAPTPTNEKRRTVPTLAYGRLEVAVEMNALQEAEPQWSKDQEYFSLRANERRVLNLRLSSTLVELEKQILAEPRKGGCFVLAVDEVYPVTVAAFSPHPLQSSNTESWSAFWAARETFFNRVRKADTRNVIEVADWTPELAGSALRYAQVYQKLIDDLIANKCERSELLDALSVDTLLIKVAGSGNTPEDAAIILPTHPLRAAWYASYTQLLSTWESQLLQRQLRQRKNTIDMQSLRLLVPANVPPFVHHAASKKSFIFFQNLRFFHGIALPANVPDPHRRCGDLAIILAAGLDQMDIGDIHPDHLTEHLIRFQEQHPYLDTLVTTLINPDRGDFFAEALKKLLQPQTAPTQEEIPYHVPAFQITSYVEDGYKNTLHALDEVRQLDYQQRKDSDHFLPTLTTTVRPISQLDRALPPEAHIAVVTDFTRPTFIPVSQPPHTHSNTSSFSLYGLIARFISQCITDDNELRWYHRIVTEGIRKPEPHPAGSRYSETLIELHTALLNAGGCLFGGSAGTHPALVVRLEAKRRDLLERLHEKTNWVITLDRFFSLDYYDSPHEPALAAVARKYVLDYSPEFTEGLGHRMMVTTAWHEELGSLLSQAMDELGFVTVDQSVSGMLHYLKTISGRLALQALESSSNASVVVGLGVVTAWLQSQKRLEQAVLIPIDLHPRLFFKQPSAPAVGAERRCDLVLISLRRNIVDATFVAVKWRRGRAPLEDSSMDMALQMEESAQVVQSRFFNENRIDGALQRSYLANVLRFYFDRSRRYKLFDPTAEATFLEHLIRLEKTGLDFRPSYEGYIVSLDGEQRKLPINNGKITVLTARDFEAIPEFSTLVVSSAIMSEIPMADTVAALQSQAQPDTIPEEVGNNAPPQEGVPGDYVPWQESRQESLPGSQGAYPSPAAADSTKENNNKLNQPSDDRTQLRRITPVLRETQAKIADIIVPLGDASGECVDWRPSIKGSPHLFIVGIPGQGKSWTTTRILTALGKQHIPALVLDFHGQFADPHAPFVQTIDPTVLDAASGLPFSPFECSQDRGDWEANAYAIAEIFAYVAGLGDMQQDIIYTAIRDAYKAQGFDDESATNLVYPTLAEVLKRIEQQEQVRHIANVLARCRPLLEMKLFRPLEKSPDMLTMVRNGLVIDLHNVYMEASQLAAGAFVLKKIYKDMFHWGQADRLRLAIVLDEAHRLARDVTLPKIMKEGRKFGIAVIVASQGLGDFHQDILSNAGTKVIFRMNYPESRKVSRFIHARSGQDLPAQIERLSVGSAYVQTPEMAFGSVVQMYPLPPGGS